MKKGELYRTPRFGTVKIEQVFGCRKDAEKAGFHEQTFYENNKYGILGRTLGINLMDFGAYIKEGNNAGDM